MTSDRLGPLLTLRSESHECAELVANEHFVASRDSEYRLRLIAILVELAAQRAAVAERDDQIAALREERDSHLANYQRMERERDTFAVAVTARVIERDALAATVARVQAERDELLAEKANARLNRRITG